MVMYKCLGCGYEMDSDKNIECPMCGSTMVKSYNNEYDNDESNDGDELY